MKILAKKKDISAKSIVSGKRAQIHKKKHDFYENIAENLIVLNSEETCSICFKKDTDEFVQCPSCLTAVHKKCFAAWAKNTHIGIPHIFRCHKCYYLVKLDKEYIREAQKSAKIKPKSRLHGFQKWLEELTFLQ